MQATGYCQCGCGEKTALARQSKTERGWVKGEPLRFVAGHYGKSRRKVGTGDRFGRLLVMTEVGRSNGQVDFECRCDCGVTKTVASGNLHSGRTRSCGCLNREVAAECHRTHGKSATPTYISWAAMIARCFNPNTKDFKHWGGRGIAPCARLREFDGFFLALGERPADKTIDRIDNDGGYWCGSCTECLANAWPMNVRWATIIEQNNNQRPPRQRH